jgi:hypothetical protein
MLTGRLETPLDKKVDQVTEALLNRTPIVTVRERAKDGYVREVEVTTTGAHTVVVDPTKTLRERRHERKLEIQQYENLSTEEGRPPMADMTQILEEDGHRIVGAPESIVRTIIKSQLAAALRNGANWSSAPPNLKKQKERGASWRVRATRVKRAVNSLVRDRPGVNPIGVGRATHLAAGKHKVSELFELGALREFCNKIGLRDTVEKVILESPSKFPKSALWASGRLNCLDKNHKPKDWGDQQALAGDTIRAVSTKKFEDMTQQLSMSNDVEK